MDLGIDDHGRPRGGMPFPYQRRSSRRQGYPGLQHVTPIDKSVSGS